MKLQLGYMSILFLILTTGFVQAANLPKTAACRDYANYARTAGAAGTMVPLNRKYQACMRSASRSNRSVSRHRCPNGYYKYYIGSKWYCKENGAKALDAIGTAISIFSAFK